MDERISQQEDGMYYNNTQPPARTACAVQMGKRFVVGIFDYETGQFDNGREYSSGMSASALRSAYAREFKTLDAALAWILE